MGSIFIYQIIYCIIHYLSFFVDGATGGLIVSLQTVTFLAVFVWAPKHGYLAARRLSAETVRAQ